MMLPKHGHIKMHVCPVHTLYPSLAPSLTFKFNVWNVSPVVKQTCDVLHICHAIVKK